MVELWLPYGASEIPVRVPEESLIDILTSQRAKAPRDAVEQAKLLLGSSGNLPEAAKNTERVCVALGASSSGQLMIDLTRLLVQSLVEVGVAENAITLLLTPGASNFKFDGLPASQIICHDPHSSSTAPVHQSRDGFQPALNSSFTDSDLKVIVGELKPHHFLGYSGLCDVVFPGLASESSIRRHLSNRKGMVVSDLHKERLELASKCENLLALGFVLDADLSAARTSFGTIGECMGQLKAVAQEICSRPIKKPSDIVVMSAGGAPTDESLLRAVETFPAGLAALKRDGVMIVAAECAMGHGDTEFYEWSAERKEPHHLETRLRHSLSYDGFKATFLLRALGTHRIYLVSTIPDHYVERVFALRAAKTVNSAMQTVQRLMGSDASVTVIPDASRVIPVAPTE